MADTKGNKFWADGEPIAWVGDGSNTFWLDGMPFAVDTIILTGSGEASFSFTVSGVGRADITGSGSSSFTIAAAAVGLADIVGSGSSTFTFTGSGGGRADITGSGASTVSFAALGVGGSDIVGSGASSISFSGVGGGTSVITVSGFTRSCDGSGFVAGSVVKIFDTLTDLKIGQTVSDAGGAYIFPDLPRGPKWMVSYLGDPEIEAPSAGGIIWLAGSDPGV